MTNNITTVAIAATASGNNTIVAAVAGITVKLVGFCITADADVSFKWRSASTDKTGAQPMIAGVPNGFKVPSKEHIVATVAGEALNLYLSTSANVGGFAIVHLTSNE